MFKIKVENYLEELKTVSKESLKLNSLRDVKVEIENIKDINHAIRNFERYSELHDKEFLKSLENQDIPMRITLLNSEIKEKSEINERLSELCYYLSTLNTAVLTKDRVRAKNIIKNAMTNEYAGIKTILSELKDFSDKITDAEKHYSMLMEFLPKGLDTKLTTEKKYKDHMKKLKSIHNRQKEIFVNTTKMFLKMSKKGLKS